MPIQYSNSQCYWHYVSLMMDAYQELFVKPSFCLYVKFSTFSFYSGSHKWYLLRHLWRYPTPQDLGICKETEQSDKWDTWSVVNYSYTACAVACRSFSNRITSCALYSSRLLVHTGIFQTAQEQIQKDHNCESRSSWHTVTLMCGNGAQLFLISLPMEFEENHQWHALCIKCINLPKYGGMYGWVRWCGNNKLASVWMFEVVVAYFEVVLQH